MLEPARGDLRQSRSKAVRTMDEFGQLITFTGREPFWVTRERQKSALSKHLKWVGRNLALKRSDGVS